TKRVGPGRKPITDGALALGTDIESRFDTVRPPGFIQGGKQLKIIERRLAGAIEAEGLEGVAEGDSRHHGIGRAGSQAGRKAKGRHVESGALRPEQIDE